MIAYHILCHDNFAQVAQMLDALYSEEDCFLIDIDDGKNPDTRAIDAYADRSNVHIIRDAYIGWGGSGTLRKTVQGAFRLLKLSTQWQYYIVLSGQDLPLKKNSTIKAFLKQGHEQGKNYIRSFESKETPIEDFPIRNQTDQTRLWADRGHTKVFIEPGVINPQTHMYGRILVDVTEVSSVGEVYVSNCNPLLLRRRKAFFSQYPLHVGANWFILHRSLLEFMQDDPFTYELFDLLRSTFIPDESFFQTYISNSKFRDTIVLDYKRMILRPGAVRKVKCMEMGDWSDIEKSDAFFARKFDTQHDNNIVRKVLENRR